MKKISKLLGIVLIIALVMSMGTMAFASDPGAGTGDGEGGTTPAASTEKVTITVNRDSSYAGVTTEAGRAYTWYKIFSATYDSSVSTNASGYAEDGTANVNAGGTTGIAYYATAAVAAKLSATGNLWFDVQSIAGSDLSVVSWKDNVTADAATLQAAAAWLIANGAYEATGEMTFASAKWTAEVEKGYYVIQSTTTDDDGNTVADAGANLIAATTDINIQEKNDYPPLDKTQTDAATPQATDYSDEDVDVKVGDVISYKVKVTIPKTAAVGSTIEVWDKPSTGLTYNDDVAVKEGDNTGNATIADGTVGTGEIWHKVITVVAGSQGKDVVFSFTCTVNKDALVDTGRENTSELKYGNEYESLPDTVKFTTYFGGIYKVDPNNDEADMSGVKFALTLNDAVAAAEGVEAKDATPVNVTWVADGGYYIVDPASTSNEVETRKDGDYYTIKIRGLDKDMEYILTETETVAGYNLLEAPVKLTLTEDKGDAFANKPANEFDKVENNTGTVLPSTGGIGTTIFYVVGSILVVAAGVLLITKKRMSREG